MRFNCTEVPEDLPDDSGVSGLVPSLKSTESVTQMIDAASKIKVMGQKPVFTTANLLGNESIDRVIMKEACKRKKVTRILLINLCNSIRWYELL